MSAIRKSARKGFTLVEILIVVIILGILAAIVIPQFTNASQDARVSSLTSTLQTLRAQVQLYKLQHGDQIPNLTTDWTPLTSSSSYPATNGTTYGPYMQAAPVNPLNNLGTVSDGTASSTVSTAVGFVYDYSSGTGTGRIYGTDSTGTAIAGTGTGSSFAPY